MFSEQPMKGFEPLTYALRERRSTPELHRQNTKSCRHYRYTLNLVKFLPILIFFLSCTKSPNQLEPGVFALSFENSSDVYQLDGEWFFRWENSDTPQVIRVPGYFNHQLPIPPKGEAVYQALLVLPQKDLELGLDIGEIQSSFEVFVNGAKIGGRGNPLDQRETGVDIRPMTLFFTARGKTQLEIRTANYFNPIGGIGDSLLIGGTQYVYLPRFVGKLVHLVANGLLLFLFLYFLFYSLFGFQKTTYLSLSGLIFFSMIRDNLMNYRLIAVFFPAISSALLTRLEYLTILGIGVFFVAYIWRLSQEPTLRYVFLVLSVISFLYLLILLALPFDIFLNIFKFYIALLLITLTYILFLIVVHQIIPPLYRIPYLMSLIPLFLGATHDLIQGFFMLRNFYLFTPSMFIYIVFQAGILHRIQQQAIANTLKNQQEIREVQRTKNDLLVSFLPVFQNRLNDLNQILENLPPTLRESLTKIGYHRLVHVFRSFEKFFMKNHEVNWTEVENLIKTLPDPTIPLFQEQSPYELSILVVDDERVNRFLITTLLAREGAIALHAESGSEALEVLKNTHVDILLIDVMMPPPNGYETILELKNSPLEVPPFCFITAKSEHHDVLYSLRLGAFSFQVKPFSIKNFFPRARDYFLLTKHPNPHPSEAPIAVNLKLLNAHPNFSNEEHEKIESCIQGSFSHLTYHRMHSTLTAYAQPTKLLHDVLRLLCILDGINLSLTAVEPDTGQASVSRISGLILRRTTLGGQVPNLAHSIYLEELTENLLFFSWHSSQKNL